MNQKRSTLESFIRNASVDINETADAGHLADILQAQEQARDKQRECIANEKRLTSSGKLFRVAAIPSLLLLLLAGMFLLDRSTPRLWAVRQTLDALAGVESAIIEAHSNMVGPFTAHVKRSRENRLGFSIYCEAQERVFVVRGEQIFMHCKGSKEIETYGVTDDKLWAEAFAVLPNVFPFAPTLLEAIRMLASDWQEAYAVDAESQHKCIYIQGRYDPLNASFKAIINDETKLVESAEYWDNEKWEGPARLSIHSIEYNAEVPESLFDLEQSTGAVVISQEEMQQRWELWREAARVECEEGDFAKAAQRYIDFNSRYPNDWRAPEALVLAAICYRELEQYDTAIAYLQQVHAEYLLPRYAIMDSHYLLGLLFASLGRDEEALEQFEICLELIEQWQQEGTEEYDRTGFPERIKGEIKKLEKKTKETRQP